MPNITPRPRTIARLPSIQAVYIVLLSVVAALVTIEGTSGASADSAAWRRGIYWDSGNRPENNDEKIEKLKSMGVSVVHIWLNDNGIDHGKTPNCEAFSYTDSTTTRKLWTRDALVAFTRALQAASPPFEPIFTFSPQVQTPTYIRSLSAPEGPLTIARQLGVAVELDLEENFSERTLKPWCGAIGTPEEAARQLIATVKEKGDGEPLTLIVSTTDYLSGAHQIALAAADIVAPQLYEAKFAQASAVIRSRFATIWSKFKQPFMPAFSLGCSSADAKRGACSLDMFSQGVSYVAGLAYCPTKQISSPSYALWSSVRTLPGRSTIANPYLFDPNRTRVVFTCQHQ